MNYNFQYPKEYRKYRENKVYSNIEEKSRITKYIICIIIQIIRKSIYVDLYYLTYSYPIDFLIDK